MLRAILAMPFLLLAYGCLMLAYWACPGLKQKDTPKAGAWVDAPEGWEKGQH